MLALTEEQLELQGVTKGARHKIALSIQRLRDRPNLIAQLEKVTLNRYPTSSASHYLFFRRWSIQETCTTH